MGWEMQPLIDLVEKVTSREVRFVSNAWYQEEDRVFVHPEDLQGLLHELGHWIMAGDEEREWPNLLLDEWRDLLDDEERSELPPWALHANDRRVEKREAQAVYFEMVCLQGTLAEDTEKGVLQWWKDHAQGGGPDFYLKGPLSKMKLRNETCERLKERIPYPSFIEEVRTALLQCHYVENEEE